RYGRPGRLGRHVNDKPFPARGTLHEQSISSACFRRPCRQNRSTAIGECQHQRTPTAVATMRGGSNGLALNAGAVVRYSAPVWTAIPVPAAINRNSFRLKATVPHGRRWLIG